MLGKLEYQVSKRSIHSAATKAISSFFKARGWKIATDVALEAFWINFTKQPIKINFTKFIKTLTSQQSAIRTWEEGC